MNLILTKKRTVLDDTLDALMRLSYRKTKQNVYETQEITDTWKHKKKTGVYFLLSYISVTFSRTDFLVDHIMVFVTCL